MSKNRLTKIVSLLLVVVMFITAIPLGGFVGLELPNWTDVLTIKASANGDVTQTSEFSGGDGTKENPFLIATPSHLNAVRNHLDSYFKQVADIDMSEWGSWNPIGCSNSIGGSTLIHELPKVENTPFTGFFDGNNKTIFGLSINNSEISFSSDLYGLFASLEKASIKNIRLVDVNYELDKSTTNYVDLWNTYGAQFCVYVGGIAGKSIDSTVDNCMVSGTISVIHCSDAFVGGVVGYGIISNCINKANIYLCADKDSRYENDSNIHCGGLTGHSYSVNGNITNCSNYGNIEAYSGTFSYVGGISGEYGRIENCVNYGSINSETTSYTGYSSFAGNCNVGGIVGATSSDYTRYCVNYGSISGGCPYRASSYAGGIVGYCGYYGSGNIYSCVNNSDSILSATYDKNGSLIYTNAGRIAGYTNKISDCYSYGNTVVNTQIVSGVSSDKNGADCTKEVLSSKTPYVDFDFDSLWIISNEIGGAVLNHNNEIIDTDGDGISDEWEKNGIDFDGDGKIDLDLKAMGADPNVPDIFVEIDWMVRPAEKFLWWETKSSNSFKPSENVLRTVYDVFNEHKINLHLDAGSDSTDFVTGKKWGNLSGGNEIKYYQTLDADKGYQKWNSLIDMANIRRLVFHHCIFADLLYSDTTNTTSGQTPGFGQIFAVTLGGWGTVNETTIAGTFMHELGHSLGLHHGGCDDEHYKPNYLSIMNYAFQTTGLAGTGKLTYSDYVLPEIDESKINEKIGLDPNGLTAGTNIATTIFYRTASQITTGSISKTPIDYNGNGTFETNISLDLNPNGNVSDSPISILKSFKDWTSLNYKSGIIGSGIDVENIPTLSISENTVATNEKTLEESLETATLAIDGIGCVELVSSTIVKDVDNQNIYLDIINLGANDTSFSVQVKSSLFDDYNEQVDVRGSKTKIEKTRIKIPVNAALEVGEYSIFCTVSNRNFNQTHKDFSINLYKPTQQDINEMAKILTDEKYENEIDSNILNEIKNVINEKTDNSDSAENCYHICHKGGFAGFIYKIIRIFWKLFRINKTCSCGVNHY